MPAQPTTARSAPPVRRKRTAATSVHTGHADSGLNEPHVDTFFAVAYNDYGPVLPTPASETRDRFDKTYFRPKTFRINFNLILKFWTTYTRKQQVSSVYISVKYIAPRLGEFLPNG
jgi:hypothetical protein